MLFFFRRTRILNKISFHQTEKEQKCLLSLFSRPLVNTRVCYIFLINALSKVVVLLLPQSYDDGRRIFVNKLGSL